MTVLMQQQVWFKNYTVQLTSADGEAWRVVWSWPLAVMRAFCGPLEYFSLDDSGVGTSSAFGGDAKFQFADGAVP
jgi:hypothetical protein